MRRNLRSFLIPKNKIRRYPFTLKLPLNIAYETVIMLIDIKSLGLGVKVDYWCKRNIRILADNYNMYYELLQDIYERFCFKNDKGQYMSVDDKKHIIFNLKSKFESDTNKFNKELNDLMTMTTDEFEPYIMSEEVFNNLPNIESSKFNIDLLAFLLPE